MVRCPLVLHVSLHKKAQVPVHFKVQISSQPQQIPVGVTLELLSFELYSKNIRHPPYFLATPEHVPWQPSQPVQAKKQICSQP